jgi:hypothetical protein
MTWITLQPGWQDKTAITAQALGMKWPTMHIEHESTCPKTWALISTNKFPEVVKGCTCSTLRFRPFRF